MDIRSVFILFFILLIVCPCVEQRNGGKANRNTNKRPRRVKKRNRLEKLCKEQEKTKSSGTALELHAYFDLRPGQKVIIGILFYFEEDLNQKIID